MAARRSPATAPVLSARLDLPDGEFDVHAGQIVRLPDDRRHVEALLGVRPDVRPPGAGRAAASGGRHRVVLAGRRLGRRSRAWRARAGLVGVGVGLGGAEVAPDVTVLEHLAAVCGRSAAADLLAAAPHLADRGADPAGVLSGGERGVLDWLIADALRPQAAVLDRAGTGLDPDALGWAHGVLDRWLDAGAAVLVRVGRADEERWLTQRANGDPRG